MPGQTSAKARRRELLLRLASASVLIPLGLISVWQGGWLLAVIASVASGAMAFEYGRMAQSRVGPLMIAVCVGTCLGFIVSAQMAGIILMVGGLLAAALEQRDGGRFTTFFGCVYAGGLALGVLVLRAHPEAGFVLTMGVMLASWASDTGAYFVGRAVGGPLLAPKDSPNKTWSGAMGGVAGASASSAAFALLIGAAPLIWALAGVFVSIMAQFGDLFESQIKRRHGVKDTSGILPGHGGVMDRVDGFGTAVLAFVLVIWFFPDLSIALRG